MVEAGAKEVSDEEMLKALEKSHEIIKKICEAQIDYLEKYKKSFGITEPKIEYNLPDEELYKVIYDYLTEDKLEVLYNK
jgi:polyribonucleotide nucleotidyltransferase